MCDILDTALQNTLTSCLHTAFKHDSVADVNTFINYSGPTSYITIRDELAGQEHFKLLNPEIYIAHIGRHIDFRAMDCDWDRT
jgi:hypothetical protein